MFLDTNVIILSLNENLEKKYLDLIEEYILRKDIHLSSVVVGEVLGFHEYTEDQSIEIYRNLKRNFKIVNTNMKITLLASSIARSKRRSTGKKLKLTDALIAATAIIHNKPLLTFDQEDFRDIEALELV